MNTSGFNQGTRSTGRIIRAADFPEAVALAAQNADCVVEVFLADWSEVDRRRSQAAALGLAGRIGIHHLAALHALVRLRVLPASLQHTPTSPQDRGPTPRLLENFVLAVTAMCRPASRLASIERPCHE